MTTTAPLPADDLDAHGGAPPADPPRRRHPLREVAVAVLPVYPIVLALCLAMPGKVDDASPASLLAMLTPAAVLGVGWLVARRRGPANPHPFGLRRPGLRFWPVAVVVPAVAICVPFALVWALGIISFDGLGPYALDAPFSLVLLTVLVLGEEIGWRGYVLPRLAEVLPVRRAAVATGVLQAVLHLPLLLLTPTYAPHGSRWVVVPGVVLVLVAAGPIFGWLRVRSGSLWPAAIAHATVNTCLVEAPVLVSDRPDLAAHLAGEGGLFTLVLVVLSAIVVGRADWTPRSKLA